MKEERVVEQERIPDGVGKDVAHEKGVSIRKCPTCGKELSDGLYARQSFCSRRCREMDLLKWLNEEYRVPVEDNPGEWAGDQE